MCHYAQIYVIVSDVIHEFVYTHKFSSTKCVSYWVLISNLILNMVSWKSIKYISQTESTENYHEAMKMN